MPMDGYHLTRADLDKLPNPALAHARRGPYTVQDTRTCVHIGVDIGVCTCMHICVYRVHFHSRQWEYALFSYAQVKLALCAHPLIWVEM